MLEAIQVSLSHTNNTPTCTNVPIQVTAIYISAVLSDYCNYLPTKVHCFPFPPQHPVTFELLRASRATKRRLHVVKDYLQFPTDVDKITSNADQLDYRPLLHKSVVQPKPKLEHFVSPTWSRVFTSLWSQNVFTQTHKQAGHHPASEIRHCTSQPNHNLHTHIPSASQGLK